MRDVQHTLFIKGILMDLLVEMDSQLKHLGMTDYKDDELKEDCRGCGMRSLAIVDVK